MKKERQRVFTVYRMNPEDKTREPIGRIIERRKSERFCNRFGLLQLARKEYSHIVDEMVCIGLHDDWPEEAQGLS